MTATAPAPRLSARERLARVAPVVEPILNRVVVTGPPVIGLLLDDPTAAIPQIAFAEDSVLQLLSTSMIDRLGLELQKLGLVRIGHGASSTRWRLPDGEAVNLVQVSPGNEDPGQVWLEYATLLTLPCPVTPQLAVRIAGAPAMLALDLFIFERGNERAIESEELERVVLLIAGRREIEHECASAPPELRAFVSASLARLVRRDSLQLLIQRALPDAAVLPALARRVKSRIERLAR